MGIRILPSDLIYRYPRNHARRNLPKFRGTPDPELFDRNDLFELIPMFEAVMDALETNDGRVLTRMEELVNNEMPAFLRTREEVFDFLVTVMGDVLRPLRR